MIVTVLCLLSSILSREFFWLAPISSFLLVTLLFSAGLVVIGRFSGSLGTGHKVQRGGWAGKICSSGDGFFVDPPLNKG